MSSFSPKKKAEIRQNVSTIPYSLVVPPLVVMVQSAWVVKGWGFHNTLLSKVFKVDWALFFGLAIIAFVSFFLIRPYERRASRWMATCLCVAGFTALIVMVLPMIAE